MPYAQDDLSKKVGDTLSGDDYYFIDLARCQVKQSVAHMVLLSQFASGIQSIIMTM